MSKNIEKISLFIKENLNKCGIYSISCKGKSYIGSSNSIGIRITSHFTKLKRNKHINKELQKDYNLYSDQFDLKVLELVENHINLLERERFWKTNIKDNYHKKDEIIDIDLSLLSKDEFEKYIVKTNTCWIWIGDYRPTGYGRFYFNKKRYTAHRISYILYKNTNIDNKILLHTCDNKKCVNPEHLVPGSHHENAIDRRNKKIGRVELNFELITKIRNYCLNNKHLFAKDLIKNIKNEFNINLPKHQLFTILLNKTWKDENWIPLNCKRPPQNGSNNYYAKFNDNLIQYIRNLYNTTNYTLNEISTNIENVFKIKVNYKTIHKIVKNKRWVDQNYIPMRRK